MANAARAEYKADKLLKKITADLKLAIIELVTYGISPDHTRKEKYDIILRNKNDSATKFYKLYRDYGGMTRFTFLTVE